MGHVMTKNGSEVECPSERKQLCMHTTVLMACLLRDLQVAKCISPCCEFCILTKQMLFGCCV